MTSWNSRRSSSRTDVVPAVAAGCPDARAGAWISQVVETLAPIQFYSCFISYSSKDTPFAERLHADHHTSGASGHPAPEMAQDGPRRRPTDLAACAGVAGGLLSESLMP